MGEQARSAPCVAWVNAKKSIHAPSIQPFLFAAGNLRNMTNPFSEYSQFDALTVSDLIFFVSLFESRSLSNTAAEGGLSLSTASRTLRKLRETFGDPLFLRSSPDFVPTSRATELYPKVAMLLENLRRLERPACFDPATLTRTFRIGVVDNAVCAVMSGVVKAFFEAAPRASLSFRQITDSLFDDLADGTLDCAVYPETRSIPSGIQDLLLYPISYALCVRKGHPLVEASREKGEVTLDMLRHWRKISVTNRGQNRLEVYCMDETTVLGEALQETAVTIPYFLAVPSLLNPRTSRPSCPCRRQDSSRNGTASSPFPFISVPKATAAGAPSTPASSGTNASPTNPPCSGCADSSRSTPTGRIRRRRQTHKSTLRLRTKTRMPARNKDPNEAAPIQREPGRLPFFQAQAPQTGQDLRSST